MMKNKYVLVALLTPALLLAGCQKAEAKTTVNATSYKKVYITDTDRFRLEIDYFVFYGENGRKYKVDPEDIEYEYVTNNKSKVKAIVTKGDYNTAVITLPMSQDSGMR